MSRCPRKPESDLRPAPVFFGEQDVVIGIGVERRVQINEINRLVLDVAAENVQVVPVVEKIGRAFRHDVIHPFMYFVKSIPVEGSFAAGLKALPC